MAIPPLLQAAQTENAPNVVIAYAAQRVHVLGETRSVTQITQLMPLLPRRRRRIYRGRRVNLGHRLSIPRIRAKFSGLNYLKNYERIQNVRIHILFNVRSNPHGKIDWHISNSPYLVEVKTQFGLLVTSQTLNGVMWKHSYS